ncbi:MAG: NADH:flavin oxidoreductase [Myxococcota bacterium]
MVSLDPLFTPFSYGDVSLRNRFVMAPMTRSRSPGGVPTDDVVAYYRRRAESEVGLITSEGTLPGHPAASAYPDVPEFHGDGLAGWRKVIAAVREAGGVMVPQLWHVGSYRQPGLPPDPSVNGYGPSAIPHPGGGRKDKPAVPAHEMSVEDIEQVIGAFRDSAAAAKELGFHGVEIHGAHGYLIDQFFWERTNQRTDAFGGSLQARTKFACELIKAVRSAVGPDFPVTLRYSQWKLGDYEAQLVASPAELEAFLLPLSEAGVDIFHCSTRRYWEPEFDDLPLNLAGWTKKITGKPVITVGSVGFDRAFIERGQPEARPLDRLVEMVAEGEVDLVALGRALLADPGWVKKAKEGRLEDVDLYTHQALKVLH